MANEWSVSYPLDHTLISDIPGEVRKLKTSVKAQLNHEHEIAVDGDATGSEHSSGSAVAYEGASTPVNRPGGAALADNAVDRGRTWVNGNNISCYGADDGLAMASSLEILTDWSLSVYMISDIYATCGSS